MRLVQNNSDCAICRKPCPQVFVTRFMDQHTRRVGTDAWDELVVRHDGKLAQLAVHCCICPFQFKSLSQRPGEYVERTD